MKDLSLKVLKEKIEEADRSYLARAISLAESSLESDRILVHDLLKELGKNSTTASKNKAAASSVSSTSLRLGVTGSPGVGKSTFIEKLGLKLIEEGNKVAVLAVDPTSPISGGSILGDKTRMQELSRSSHAFIRPSPSRGALGGVTRSTQLSIALCEAAGFNRVIVESVGVGQSEFAVANMVDVFIFLTLANAGDDLQGIKRGILEYADLVVVNKADGNKVKESKSAARMFAQAFSILFSGSKRAPEVLALSSLSDFGWDEFFDALNSFVKRQLSSESFLSRRTEQSVSWFESELRADFENWILKHKDQIERLSEEVRNGRLDPLEAANQLKIK